MYLINKIIVSFPNLANYKIIDKKLIFKKQESYLQFFLKMIHSHHITQI